MSDIRDDEDVQAAIRNLFVGCAPERAVELAELWQKLSPRFQMTEDNHDDQRFIMDAGAYRYVRFNHRAVRAFWLAAYIAWEGYRAVAEATTLDAVDFTRFREMLDAFGGVITSDQPTLEPLPDGVPEPGTFPKKGSEPQAHAAAELATIASGWALLHEVRHIKHQQENTSADPYDPDPTARREEEMSCDTFATTFILDQLDAYAASTGVEPSLVSQKRQLGIYFALFALTLLAQDNWEASDTHPSVQTRIDAAQRTMRSFPCGLAEAIAHTAFTALRIFWVSAPGPFVEEQADS